MKAAQMAFPDWKQQEKFDILHSQEDQIFLQ
jgi:hypothetical protein